ncbi:MAG: CoA transferase, partial [Pseudomonadota bacterium]|nr:CoA transferase [Pseudomonadota bacterium]
DVAGLAQATIAGVALAASEVWRAATGAALAVRVDRRHAALEFRSERVFEVDGRPPEALWDPLAGAYCCGDGRWLRVHTNFAHHRKALCQVLGCAETPAAVTAALAGRAAGEVESAAAEAGAIAAMMRPMEAWRDSAQGQAVAGLPLISLARIGAAPKTPVRARARPLDGLKVLDLTRVIAGPVCGRVLAAHGADVLAISAPHLPSMAELTVDVGRGKRSAHLDLRADEDGRHLAALIGDADIFVQGYRPGGLAARGFGPAAVAALKPGIIYVSLSAYGHTGPWAGRRGFDSIAQTAIGLNHSEARAAGLADQPQVLPAQALDHASGYLMALGALAAVLKRAQEGGSWHVQVALARTG